MISGKTKSPQHVHLATGSAKAVNVPILIKLPHCLWVRIAKLTVVVVARVRITV
jgi:hypothetical protein